MVNTWFTKNKRRPLKAKIIPHLGWQMHETFREVPMNGNLELNTPADLLTFRVSRKRFLWFFKRRANNFFAFFINESWAERTERLKGSAKASSLVSAATELSGGCAACQGFICCCRLKDHESSCTPWEDPYNKIVRPKGKWVGQVWDANYESGVESTECLVRA